MRGNFGLFCSLARNCLPSTLDYIVMQIRKINRDRGCLLVKSGKVSAIHVSRQLACTAVQTFRKYSWCKNLFFFCRCKLPFPEVVYIANRPSSRLDLKNSGLRYSLVIVTFFERKIGETRLCVTIIKHNVCTQEPTVPGKV